jgi:hypothetical protein
MTNASTIFSFLAQHDSCCIERNEIALAPFGVVRRCLRSMIKTLRDSQDPQADEIADQMRKHLLRWLTTPVKFDAVLVEDLKSFGDPATFEMRWGIGGEYRAALSAAVDLVREENPLRAKLRQAIARLQNEGGTFRIYCHRSARPDFDNLFDHPLGDDCFLHTVRDYHHADLFGSLIKVGPLRAMGWGAAPDALLSAPRFETLVQVVWAGCADDPGFGYDPVAPQVVAAGSSHHASTNQSDALVSTVTWRRVMERTGEDPLVGFDYRPEEDEFQTLRDTSQPGQKRRAVLVEIEHGDGILYPPSSPILSFDPQQPAQSIALRHVGLLTPGMFVVQAQIGDLDFGGLLTSEGRYARVWKARLQEEARVNLDAICRILSNKGVSLRCLPACVESWCKSSTTVIHAPQQRQHFKILIDVLALDEVGENGQLASPPWWQKAWNEIRISRGEAIQAGVQGHVVIEQRLIDLLNDLLPEIQRKAAEGAGFRIPIPVGRDLSGGFVFHRVLSTEDGFEVPDTELKVVRELNSINRWRMA